MKTRITFLLLFLTALAAGAYAFLRNPTPLPLRLLDACPPPEGQTSPYALIGPETRFAYSVKAAWRCEIPLTPDPRSALSLGVGRPDPAQSVTLRVAFDPVIGPVRVLRDGPVAAVGAGLGWQDVRVTLEGVARLPGRLVLEIETDAGEGAAVQLGEPVLFLPRNRPEKNVIVVLLDTLRADRMGYAGYARTTTPRLDELASEGAFLENAYAPTSWTRPSTATLHTGLEPLEHQVHTRRDHLAPRFTTLAERLRDVGYATTAFTSNPNILTYWGFHQGFERFVDVDADQWVHNDDVARMIDLALEELGRVRDRPFFLYLHVNQIHAPYVPPETDLAAVGGDAAIPSDLYDGEIHFADREVGRLWERIRSLSLDDRTLLVVAGDHGEEFGEHGGTYHGRTLYEEVLRVPVFLRYPEAIPRGSRVAWPVPLSALYSLVLDLLGFGGGVGAGNLFAGPAPEGGQGEAFDFRLDLDGQLLYALRLGRWKYLQTIRPVLGEELYDLESDPAERSNLSKVKVHERDRLARLLERRLSRSRPGLHLRLSASTEESRRLTIRLSTPAKVTGIESDMLEPGDIVGLEPEGDVKMLVINALVAGEETQVEELGRLVPRRYPDVDEVTVRLDPPDSPVEIEVLDGETHAPLDDVWLGGRRAPTRIAFSANEPGLAVSVATIEARPEGNPPVWIYVVPAGSAVAGAIREDIDQRLRALGYVD